LEAVEAVTVASILAEHNGAQYCFLNPQLQVPLQFPTAVPVVADHRDATGHVTAAALLLLLPPQGLFSEPFHQLVSDGALDFDSPIELSEVTMPPFPLQVEDLDAVPGYVHGFP